MRRHGESTSQRLTRVILGIAVALALSGAAQAEGGGHWGGEGGHWSGQGGGWGQTGHWGGEGNRWGHEGNHWSGQPGAGNHWSGRADMSGTQHQSGSSHMFPRQSENMPPKFFANAPHQRMVPHVVVPPRVVAQPRVFVHPRIVRVLPPQRQVFFHHGVRFFFVNGVFFRPFGPRFITVFPPVGLVVPFLPIYASVVWIAGWPYYYADNVYYVRSSEGYVVAQPPAGEAITEEPAGGNTSGVVEEPAATNAPADTTVSRASEELYIYPTRGQSQQQQNQDRDECRRWAVDQAGYDPNASANADPAGEKFLNFQRAQSACLEGRGYTVR